MLGCLEVAVVCNCGVGCSQRGVCGVVAQDDMHAAHRDIESTAPVFSCRAVRHRHFEERALRTRLERDTPAMKGRAIEDPAACHAELAPGALYEHAATITKPRMSVLQADTTERKLPPVDHLARVRVRVRVRG